MNSAVAVPKHDEILRVPLQQPDGLQPNQPSYTLACVGGKCVNRVEISFDEGGLLICELAVDLPTVPPCTTAD